MNIQEFEKWEGKTDDVILSRRIYVEIAGDFRAGMMLGEIVYWHLRSKKDGKIRLRVKKTHPTSGKMTYWLSKSGKEWLEDVGLTRHESRQARAKLEEVGLIESHVWRFNNYPTVHVRLLWPQFLKLFEKHRHKYGVGSQTDGAGNQTITGPTKAQNTDLPTPGDSEESRTSISPADDQEVSPADAAAGDQLLAASKGKTAADFGLSEGELTAEELDELTGVCDLHDVREYLFNGDLCESCEADLIVTKVHKPSGWSTVAEVETDE